MEFFRNTNIDFLGKKWYFLAFSLVFSIAGVFSMLFWHGIPLGVDFRGGTLVYVKFNHTPDDNQIRAAMDRAGLHNARIQRYGPAANNEVLVRLEQQETSEASLDRGKQQIINALERNAPAGKQDLNNISSQALRDYLLQKDPLHAGTDATQRYTAVAQAIVDYRDKVRGGVLKSLDELKGTVDPAVILPWRRICTSRTLGFATWKSLVPRWAGSCADRRFALSRFHWQACWCICGSGSK